MQNLAGNSLWNRFRNELDLLTSCGEFRLITLGHVDKLPLYLLETVSMHPGKPSILVSAGFHGDEPAGVWASLLFARNYHHMACCGNVNISLLPLVNPTGFCVGTHTNSRGRDPNRGFCNTSSGVPEVSEEGSILMANANEMRRRATDGFLSLHEDFGETRFYMFTFERTPEPDRLSQELQKIGARYFNLYPEGELDGARVRAGGIIFCECDGSYEDFLFHCGVPRTACTETPGKLDMQLRIQANVELITTFANLVIHTDERCNE
jgi:hypothetical protein